MATQPLRRDGVERAASFRGPLLAAVADPARLLRHLRRLGGAGAAFGRGHGARLWWHPRDSARPSSIWKAGSSPRSACAKAARWRPATCSWSWTTRGPGPSTAGARPSSLPPWRTAPRLAAEQEGADRAVFPDDLLAEAERGPGDPGADRRRARRAWSPDVRRSSTSWRCATARSRRLRPTSPYEGSLASIDRQIELIDEEIATVEDLLRKGLDRKPRLLALQRARADLDGQRNAAVANAAGTRELIIATPGRARRP